MVEIRIVGIGKIRGYPCQMCKNNNNNNKNISILSLRKQFFVAQARVTPN